MDDSLIEYQLRHFLGEDIDFHRYDTIEERTLMTYVISEAENQLDRKIPVYWVNGGYPDIFNLSDEEGNDGMIVFSTRHLFAVSHIRQLFVNNILSDGILEGVSERLMLQITAELALRIGDPDFACLAFAKSLVDKSFSFAWGLNEVTDLYTLEYESKNEAYMATWFYGLLHEYGHFLDSSNSFGDHPLLTKEIILETAKKVLDALPYPADLKQSLIDKILKGDGILGLDNLREEIAADIFGAGALFKSTFEIMQEIGQEEFEIFRFAQEVLTSNSILFLLNTCKRMAKQGLMEGQISEDESMKNIYLPVALNVRINMLTYYLEMAIMNYLDDSNKDEKLHIKVRNAIDHLINENNKLNAILEAGWSNVIKFTLFTDKRKQEGKLLMDNLEKEIVSNENVMTKIELNSFCEKLERLNKSGQYVDQILMINSMHK